MHDQELDAVASGASDGRIVLHCLKNGQYVRQCSLQPSSPADGASAAIEVSQLAFSCHGDVVACSWDNLCMYHFSLNGTHLATAQASTAMNCIITAGEGQYLLGGGRDGCVGIYKLHNLELVHTLDLRCHGEVTCMRLSADKEYLLVGSEDGEVSIITDARRRLHMLDVALRREFVG